MGAPEHAKDSEQRLMTVKEVCRLLKLTPAPEPVTLTRSSYQCPVDKTKTMISAMQ
jgi:hypothetical protein